MCVTLKLPLYAFTVLVYILNWHLHTTAAEVLGKKKSQVAERTEEKWKQK